MPQVHVAFLMRWFMLEHAGDGIINSLNKYLMSPDYVQCEEMLDLKLYLIIISKPKTFLENL